MIVTVYVEQNETTVLHLDIVKEMAQGRVILRVLAQQQLDLILVWVLVPYLKSPRLIGTEVDRAFQWAVKVDLEPRPVNYDAVRDIGDELRRERIFLA